MKEALKFNDLDTYYKTDRRSLTGMYEVIQGVPRLGHVPFSLLGSLTKTMQGQMRVQKCMETVADPDLQISGGGRAVIQTLR